METVYYFIIYTLLLVFCIGKLLLIFGQDPKSPIMKTLTVLLILTFCVGFALTPFII